MHITDIELRSFRNIAHAEISLQNGVNAVFGENGQGKTNLLESVFLLSGAKSFRRCKDSDLILSGEMGASVAAGFWSRGRDQHIRLTVDEKGRHISLNKGTATKASAAAGALCCVVFSPEHLSLIKGSPDERRRFIDTALCQTGRSYLADLRMYTRLLNQKNNLLKDCYRFPSAQDLLSVYDRQLASAASSVTAARLSFIKELLPIFSDTVRRLSGSIDEVSFSYRSTLFEDEVSEEEALMRYESIRGADIKAGFCTAGPHRDDLEITIGGRSMKVYGSQGQQRTAVLALKLSEADYMKSATGEEPILLLDDVLSELDLKRQDDLLDRLSGRQSVITCCDPTFITGRTDARLIEVQKGRVVSCT